MLESFMLIKGSAWGFSGTILLSGVLTSGKENLYEKGDTDEVIHSLGNSVFKGLGFAVTLSYK